MYCMNQMNYLLMIIIQGKNGDALDSIKIEISNEVKKLSNISKDLEKLKKQIPDEDLEFFFEKMESLQNRVNHEVNSIIRVIGSRPALGLEVDENSFQEEPQDMGCEGNRETKVQRSAMIHDDNLDLASEVANKRALHQSWEGLRRDLTCLNDMFNSLAATVMVRLFNLFH